MKVTSEELYWACGLTFAASSCLSVILNIAITKAFLDGQRTFWEETRRIWEHFQYVQQDTAPIWEAIRQVWVHFRLIGR